MQRQLTFGGGVSPRNTRLRGQSIIEYVLIIAIIGLVIVFAGPGVAGAIRNQFNLVGNTVNNGTTAGTEGGGAPGGGSTGADSATVQAAIAKDAKDWTLDEQKAVAEDIAAKGEASPAYAKAKAAMDAGTKFSMKLTNGKTLEYRIVGINHDDLADGSGKAGLTFEATNTVLDAQRMNATGTNVGGWDKSELRSRLNSGDLWSLLPAEIQSKVKSVKKMTDNKGGGTAGTPSVTTDKIFLLSTTEVYGDMQSDGVQYEFYKSKGVTTSNYSGASSRWHHWTRSVTPSASTGFRFVVGNGDWDYSNATGVPYVFPAFSF
ncbi:hypothetical protein COLAER_02101 [Collinsella aerofaciens ATCC 25986]|uniref:DUF6273 domain-containing protein n=1 Tax=Collinsella aerofaciens (strain ATCC 25986 / DSM 3979 / JCM 10188 / KCTC 3647 / NCTC 11838 / VPI 1003) TaxID=411903 RepID=A4ECC2_COLAA|nr:hypothetical protein COLAER_02101 [Collinsella aerofaciens ATCC 25986]SUY68945.1 Uncharacterised protein [Collinsella aerofaciens]